MIHCDGSIPRGFSVLCSVGRVDVIFLCLFLAHEEGELAALVNCAVKLGGGD